VSANVGEMFYYGEVPWHREGPAVPRPLTVAEALVAGAGRKPQGRQTALTMAECTPFGRSCWLLELT